jgi:hypothetical protein
MRAYSFQDYAMLINGVELSGFAEGDDAFMAERRADSASDKVGADGKMMVSISADKSGEFTFKLQQTSPSNKYLMALLALQEFSAKSFVPVNVLCRDTYRNDVASGTVGYIKKPAGQQRGMEGNNQEWVIVTERMDLIFGDTAENGVIGGIV